MTTVRSMVDRGIIPEPQSNEDWVVARAAKRAKNVANAREVLVKNDLEYYERLESGQVVFGVRRESGCSIEYWPEEGSWYAPGCIQPRYGLRKLVAFMKDQS